MPLQKETVTFNFSQGLDTFDDPNQIPLGKFTAIQNTVFIKSESGELGALKKRNGYQPLAATLSTVSYLSSYNNALVGLGQGSIQTYSDTAQAWKNNGYFQPIYLNVKSLIKNGHSQGAQDLAVSSSGIGCVAYQESSTSSQFQYAIFDSASSQILSGPSGLPIIGSMTHIVGAPRIFILGSGFLAIYGGATGSNNSILCSQISATFPFVLQNTIQIDGALRGIYYSTSSATGAIFDGTIASNNLILSWSSATGKIVNAKITPSLSVSTVSVANAYANTISTCFDPSTSYVYTSIGSGTSVGFIATDYNFSPIFSNLNIAVSSVSYGFSGLRLVQPTGVTNISSYATNGQLSAFYEVDSKSYNTFSPHWRTLCSRTITSAGLVGSETQIAYGQGIGSKPFMMNGGIYFLTAYESNLQSTYFLINSTGQTIAQVAYGNGGGYYSYSVPSVNIIGSSAVISYLYKDLIQAQNNTQTISTSGATLLTGAYYFQTGINYASFVFSSDKLSPKQTGNTLSINGGQLWSYDGLSAFENGIYLYPELFGNNLSSASVFGGATTPPMSFQPYQYAAVFESTDNKANVYRSAPNIISMSLNVGGSGGAFAQVGCFLSPLSNRLPSNPLSVIFYRYSQAQPIFYRVLSATIPSTFSSLPWDPIENDIVSSSINQTFVQVLNPGLIQFQDYTPDSAITGNEILYTNGGVVSDVNPPSFIATDIFDSRFWGISAEDGSLWYSKGLVTATPLEMSDNFTLYIPPNQTAQGIAFSPTCLAPLDEKQIIFCSNSILYIVGTGPDDTGQNSQYSEPAQIPSSVGCSNPNSIVITPVGLMFQSDHGIWLLGRDLSVQYVGKDVEAYNAATVLSALAVPGTTEIRFSLDSGITLVYDFLVGQWSTFNVPARSATIYGSQYTWLDSSGQVFQEVSSGSSQYLDGTTPITMSFTTGWVNLAGLQGYARAYFMDILGNFQSPHTYTIGIAYDYNPSIIQTATINPANTVGSGSSVEQWQIWFKRQQCQSFQLTFTEISSGSAGAGVVISGISLTYGRKKTYARNISPKNRTG